MKISNILYKTLLFSTVTVGLSSCLNNWLDEEPSDSINADGALKSSTDLATARTGMYSALKGTSNFTDYYAANMFVYGEVHGEDMQYNAATGSGRARTYYYMTYATASDFDRSTSVWQSPFIIIGRANRIIQAVDGGNLTDQTDAAATIAQYKAEAEVVRAMALFDLTRIYGKPYTEDNGASLGVPVDTAVLSSNTQLPRNTVAECYAQILKDLKNAISSDALSTDKLQGYVNVWAAKALLARVYITMGNNDDALSTCEDIIKNSPYTLWTQSQYVSAWGKSDANHQNEIMLEMLINNNTDWTDREGIAFLYAENTDDSPGYGDMVATKAFVDMLSSDPKDVRNNVFKAAVKDASNVFGGAKVYLNKMPPVNGDVRYANVPLLRLSEIYLTAAEAAFNKDRKDKAAEYLNDIIKNRTSDETKLVTEATVTAQRIYVERRKELVGEGQRYFDALRRGETITRYTSETDKGWHDVLNNEVKSYNRDYFKALPPIPQYEMDANPNMKQNPGYGE